MNDSIEFDVNTAPDPSVPTELLELHLELEDADVSPEEFQEVFGSDGSSDRK